MSHDPHPLRVRQAVLVATDLDAVTRRLHRELGLGEPFADPGVAHFGLRNAVFALGDTFLEVVSPIQPDTSAGRLLSRRGGDGGYMVMLQVADLARLAAARERARARGVREVFEVSLEDMSEVHLHPVDMGGAIVSLSAPVPPASWRWAGPGWRERSRPLAITGVTVSVADPGAVAELWSEILGSPARDAGVGFRPGPAGGLVEISLVSADAGARVDGDADRSVDIGGARLVFASDPSVSVAATSERRSGCRMPK